MIFAEPVSDLIAPGYSSIISNPMDLSSMQVCPELINFWDLVLNLLGTMYIVHGMLDKIKLSNTIIGDLLLHKQHYHWRFTPL